MTLSSRLRTLLLTPFLFFSIATIASDVKQDANRAPLAEAGLSRSVVVGERVTLDASGSTDLDGNRLEFRWALRTPRGSGATLSDNTALRPQFTVDLLGEYTAELVAYDGKLDSVSDTVTISTGNVAPVAIISNDSQLNVGETLVLDGSSSFDFNGDTLSYRWSLIESPNSSRAMLNASRSASPTLTTDTVGEYLIELTVSDGSLQSEATRISLHTDKRMLTADAGPDRNAYTGTRVQLNANASTKVDGKALTYEWNVLHAPNASNASLNTTDAASTVFRADVAGHYVVQLITRDGFQESRPDTVVFTAYEPPVLSSSVAQRGGSDVDGDGIPDDIDNCAEHANPSQLDTNGDGFGNRCDADIDNDGFITNFGDLVLWAAAFNSGPGQPNWNPDADFNGDNTVNFLDLFIFQGFFLTAPGPIVNRFINPLGGTWHDPANWSLGVVPMSTHSARIDIGAGVTVEYSTGSSEIDTLRSSTEMLFTGGNLTINDIMQVEAPVALSGGGTINGANILTPLTGDPMVVTGFQSFTFGNVTLGADVTIEPAASLFVNDDLTLSGGATITLASDNNFTYLRFVGLSGTSSTLGGDGEVVFGGTTTVDNRNHIEVYNSGDGLVVESGVTIRTDTSGGIFDHRSNNGPITLLGTVISDLAGRTVLIDAVPLRIEGSLQASNSGVIDAFFRGADGTISSTALLSADTGGELQLRGDWVNNGTISVTDATLDLGNTLTADWDNNGTITLSNATLELGGSFTVADVGNVTGTGTTIIDGSLDNTGMTLDTGVDLPGTTVLPGNGGIILGGSIVNTPMTLPTFDSFTLENVTLGADFTIEPGASLFVNDDLTLSGGATITLASDNNFTYLRFVGLSGTTSTLGGNGEVVFGGTTTVDNRNNIEAYNSGDGLVIGPGVTIRSTTTGGTLDHRSNNGPITIQGTVISDLAGRTVLIDAAPLTIEGSLQASNSGVVDVFFRGAGGTITSTAMLSADTGGELQLRGDWVNNGTISVTDATLDLGNTLTADWNNNGTITLNNATLELGGDYTTADIGNVTGTGTVIINGRLDNTGMTLDTGVDLPGTTVLLGSGGIIIGGSIVNTPVTVTTFVSFTLENVTLGADLTIEPGASLFVNDDLTLSSGATITLASDNNFTYLRFVGLSGTSSTLGGDGEVVFGGTTTVDNRNNIEVYNSGDGLVVGPGVTIRSTTTGGTLDHRSNNGPITLQGTVISDLAGRTVLVDAAPLSIEGSLQASNTAILDAFFRGAGGTITSTALLSADTGGELQLRGDWVSDGTISVTDATLDLGNTLTADWDNNGTITLSNATLELGGDYTTADIGNVTGTGTVIINGRLDNTGMTLDAGVDLPGTTVLFGSGGIITGGSIVNTPVSVSEFVSFTLENVTLGADLTVERGAALFVNDDLTLSGGATITLASDNNFTYMRFVGLSGTTSTLGGDGEVVFGGTATVDNRNNVEVYNSGDGLVVGPGVTIRSTTSGGTFDHRFNNGPITIQGAVISDLAGRTVLLNALPLSIEGTLQASNSAVLDTFFQGVGGTITSTATLFADTGGELQLRGDWVSDGTISVTDATLDIGNTLTANWDNNGTITLSNATLELGGSFTLADVGNVTGTGTTIIDGSLDNAGMTLDTGADLPGTTVVFGNGGIILGGSIVNTPVTLTAFDSFTLENVTLGADLTVEPGASLFINDDLTLSGGATITLASDNNFTYMRFVGLSGTTSTLGGNGEVVFGGTASVDNRNNIEVYNSGDGLVVGSGVTIRTDTSGGIFDHRFNNGPITMQGTVISEVAGRTVSIGAFPLNIEGTLESAAGSIINFTSDYTLSGTAALNADIGGAATSDFGRYTALSRTANLNGALNINIVNAFAPALSDTFQIMTFASRNGTFSTENGTTIGGGLSFDVGYNATDVTLQVIN